MIKGIIKDVNRNDFKLEMLAKNEHLIIVKNQTILIIFKINM